ncbi:cache domain-containing protein [Vibrio sinaloensis]|nr:cache domain-containing protein [Vibrio sinaloensis]
MGFGKYFEPYDWFIGTGDYVVDVENDIKQTVLAWIKKTCALENLAMSSYSIMMVRSYPT